MPYASSSSTRSTTNDAAGSWGTNATTSARRRGAWASVSRPSTSTRPENVPPVKCGTRPFAARRNVDLPAPVGPTARTNVPSSMASVTSASAAVRRSG